MDIEREMFKAMDIANRVQGHKSNLEQWYLEEQKKKTASPGDLMNDVSKNVSITGDK